MTGDALRRRRVGIVLCLALAARAAAGTAAEPDRAADADYSVTTVAGDTLIGLSRRLLAQPARWPEVARANALRDPNRIAVGTVLRVPLRLMRTEPVTATVTHVTGEGHRGAAPLQAGQPVAEGEDVNTGPDGHATIQLVDGTLLRLGPASRLRVSESRSLPDAAAVRSRARLEQGRVDVQAAPAPAGRPGFRIETPQGVLGVRGTEFRVASDTDQRVTRGEVLLGRVDFEGPPGAPAQRVEAGYGSVIAAGGEVAAPIRLLPRIELGTLPALQEQVLMRFELPPLAGAAAYRGQISRDAQFNQVVADLTSATPALRFADLPDGDYLLRVRAIDGLGLEGEDADLRFRLKARPEAPLPVAPAPGAIVVGGRVEFRWAANDQARTYRLRLAAGGDFTAPLRDLRGLTAVDLGVEGLTPGPYQWQLASVRGDDDQGPWGVARAFEIRPPPPTPEPPRVGDDSVSFAWEGAPGQSFDFDIARDAGFADILVQRRLDRPQIELPAPGTGRFFVRLRVRDADGFVGPYSAAQHFDVPNCLRSGAAACVRAADQPLNLQP